MNNNYLHAQHYHKLGFNVTCIGNELNIHNFYCRNILKNPDHAWKEYFNQRQSEAELNDLNWNKSTGVGIVTGIAGLIAIDIDGCTNYEILHTILKVLDLPLTYEWVCKTGSNNGFQILCFGTKMSYIGNDIAASTYPANNNNLGNFEKIEFLWKTHLVLPPSLHSSGNTYQFINCKIPTSTPLTLSSKRIEKVIDYFLDSKLEKHGIDYGIFDEKKQEHVPHIVEIKRFHPLDNIKIDQDNLEPEIKNAHCIIDIETDGLIKDEDLRSSFPNILQIAWILMNNEGKILKRSSTLIKSDQTSNNAIKVNLINLNIANQIGVELSEALRLLSIDLRKASSVVAHNKEFDLRVLNYYFDRYGVFNPIEKMKQYCTMRDAQQYYSRTFKIDKFLKLTEMYELMFKIKPTNLHNAENDVLITAKCYRNLLKQKVVLAN